MKCSLALRSLCALICLGLLLIHEPVWAKAKPDTKSAKASKSAKKAGKVSAKYRLVKRDGKTIRLARAPRVIIPAKPSLGKAIGLHAVDDPLDLHSGVAVVVDSKSNEVLFSKNPGAILPIASITKLMTAMVILDERLSLNEQLEINEADLDNERHSRSKLRPGARLSRGEMMQLALMSSENRAAHVLGRSFPGGLPAFMAAMNAKAKMLGMSDSHFHDPTGLSSNNVSTGQDLVKLVHAAASYPLIRQYSTATELAVDTGVGARIFRNTNRLIESSDWQIVVSKTGYIAEAGNCLVMHANIEGRPLIMVLLDADGRRARYGDAQRLRQWLETVPIKANHKPPKMAVQVRAAY